MQAHTARQLDQRQGVAARLCDELLAKLLIERRSQHGVQQRPRIGRAQTLDLHPRQGAEVRKHNPRRQDHANRLGAKATRDKRKSLCRSVIQPLQIIDQADQGLIVGHFGKQGQHGQPGQKALRCRT